MRCWCGYMVVLDAGGIYEGVLVASGAMVAAWVALVAVDFALGGGNELSVVVFPGGKRRCSISLDTQGSRWGSG